MAVTATDRNDGSPTSPWSLLLFLDLLLLLPASLLLSLLLLLLPACGCCRSWGTISQNTPCKDIRALPELLLLLLPELLLLLPAPLPVPLLLLRLAPCESC